MDLTIEEDVRFIETDLLPEMVHNRCFCEADSREFVELESAVIKPLRNDVQHLDFMLYRVKVVIQFSGVPETFYVLVKLLPENSSCSLAYDGFLNEEILWNKATLQYGKEFFPKFYVADMGKYGRPVIVVEDLESIGFKRVINRQLNQEEARIVLEMIGKFHGKGMLLKDTKYSVYREFYAKFQEITLAQSSEVENKKKLLGFLSDLKATMVSNQKKLQDIENMFGSDPYTTFKDCLLNNACESSTTICQGLLIKENLWFKKQEAESKSLQVRILDWQRIRHGCNSIDLATVLAQCEADNWDELIQIYIKALQTEQPTAKVEEIRKGIINPGFLYALLILSSNTDDASQICNGILHFME